MIYHGCLGCTGTMVYPPRDVQCNTHPCTRVVHVDGGNALHRGALRISNLLNRFAGTTRSRRTHNRCRGRRRNRPAETASPRSALERAAAALWAWETRCSCHQRRRRRRHRPRFPPIRRLSAPTCPACPPARPSCACSTRNTWRPSGTASSPGSPSAGRNSCTADGTVQWTPRMPARRSSDPTCKQVRYPCIYARCAVATAVVPEGWKRVPDFGLHSWDGLEC